MKLKTLFALALTLAALAGAQTQPFQPGESLPEQAYSVERVIDGDTFVVLVNGVQRSVRVIGVDTPELHPPQPYAEEAAQLARDLLASRTAYLEPGEQPTDRFGRALAYVTVGERDFALTLAQAGLAELDTRPPNTRHAELYTAAVQGAVSVHKGMFADSPGRFIDRDCDYFKTRQEAQAFYEGAKTDRKRDAHRLDPDRNGLACQSLPRLR